MYVELVAQPGSEEKQLCCAPTSPHSADPDRDAVRIVMFTTAADATMALSLASRVRYPSLSLPLRTPLRDVRCPSPMRYIVIGFQASLGAVGKEMSKENT